MADLMNHSKAEQKTWYLFLVGLTMGACDTIPGVSGGTIAFISGIYQKLLDTIKGFSPLNLLVQLKKGPKALLETLRLEFLIPLGLGVLISIFGLSHAVTYLLDTQPELVWSFFFGLILASSVWVALQIPQWNSVVILGFVLGMITAYYLTVQSPLSMPREKWAFFVAAYVAICAMILPGISGSFILLLLGMYRPFLNAIKTFDFVTIFIIAAGCATGLISFARVLSYLFENYKNFTISVLTGFMFGSLNKVWPWKISLESALNSHGETISLVEKNLFPLQYLELSGREPQLFGAIFLMALGILFTFALELVSRKANNYQGSTS